MIQKNRLYSLISIEMTRDRSMIEMKSYSNHPPCSLGQICWGNVEYISTAQNSGKCDFFSAEISEIVQMLAPPVAKIYFFLWKAKPTITSSSYFDLIKFGRIPAFLSYFEVTVMLQPGISRFWAFLKYGQIERKFWKCGKFRLFQAREICIPGWYGKYWNWLFKSLKPFPHTLGLLGVVGGAVGSPVFEWFFKYWSKWWKITFFHMGLHRSPKFKNYHIQKIRNKICDISSFKCIGIWDNAKNLNG